MPGTTLSYELVKAEAARLGFNACGLSPCQPVDHGHAQAYLQWLAQGHQAGMDYMTRHTDKRLNPALLVEGCRTIVSVALGYHPPQLLPGHEPQLARYAYGTDYHTVMRSRLQALLHTLQQHYPTLLPGSRCFCDTAPVLERYWAWRGGLGWIGRHTQLVIPHAGSEFFLGELFLTLPADSYSTPLDMDCGHCHACTAACPTQALQHDGGGLDARRCLSYLTIEHRGEIPPEAAIRLTPYIYGCDRCLLACPHGRQATPTTVHEFRIKPELMAMTATRWAQLDRAQYTALFKGSAVKRAKYEGLVRNIRACCQGKAEE